MTKKKPVSRQKKNEPIILPRAPIVAVLGHVDHGKTTLLDTIRKTNLQAQETGGITQHIGAYQVSHHGQAITFIDTPGHAAFARMRQQGAQVTDLVILVIAANEGVKPQTKESIRHIKAAGVPLIVAINKMDLPGASPDKVKAQLAESEIIVEGYGGDTVCVETIAKTGQGVTDLLDMILLIAQVTGLKSNPQGPLKAIVIESKLQKNRGPVASVVIKSGTLKTGDSIQAGTLTTKVRNLFNPQGKSVNYVQPGEPTEILGFKSLPPVGAIITRFGEEKIIPTPELLSSPESPEALSSETTAEGEEKTRVKAIIKADTQGTLDAIKTNVADEVEVLGEGVGEIGEADILLADATGAKILGFRVKVSPSAQKIADLEHVEIITYQAIYELLEDLEKQVLKILEPTINEEVIGEAKIIAEFTIQKNRVAGCQIILGKLESEGTIHLIRKTKIIADAKITSLKQGPKNISLVKKGESCGLVLKPQLDFKVGDIIQYYRINESV